MSIKKVMTINEIQDALPTPYYVDSYVMPSKKLGHELLRTDDEYWGLVFYHAESLEKYIKENGIIN